MSLSGYGHHANKGGSYAVPHRLFWVCHLFSFLGDCLNSVIYKYQNVSPSDGRAPRFLCRIQAYIFTGIVHYHGHVSLPFTSEEGEEIVNRKLSLSLTPHWLDQHLDDGGSFSSALIPFPFWIPCSSNNLALGIWDWMYIRGYCIIPNCFLHEGVVSSFISSYPTL